MQSRPPGAAFGIDWRRPLDAVAAAVGLIAALPFMALTALIIRIQLGNPVFFRQRRAGRGGSTFTVPKFRTMHDTRDASGALLPDAERETPITRFIRRVRLDELPQLTAILKGDMALIGPRPLLPETIQAMGAQGRHRGLVRPGLTGWAQVSGNTRLNDRQKIALDIWYIDHRGPLLDLRILAETVLVVLLGERLRPDRIAEAEAYRDSLGLPGVPPAGAPA
ncbi:sugar transferase [Prosthecomicrobium sp. N25]|uniref:sugar transferase n=1 Tax=Prosthecomicrobium sp. N25 TaxID=3129254 RepID=UPI0030789CCA